MSDPTGAPYLTTQSFDEAVIRRPGVAVVDFTAPWCAPCKALAPHVDALSRELDGSALVAKVDVDASPELAERFGVLGFPTLLFFRDGQVVDRLVGNVPAARIRSRLESARAA